MYVSVNFFFFFFLREVLVDNLLPADVAASRSSQQWEKEPGRRVKREGRGPGGLQLHFRRTITLGAGGSVHINSEIIVLKS